MLFLLLPLRLNLQTPYRVQFVLKDGNCDVIPDTLVNVALYSFASGDPTQAGWMTLQQKAQVYTDVNGVVSIGYIGPGVPGDTVYVSVIVPGSPTPATMLWTTLIE